MPANFTGSLAISGSLLLTGSITTTGGITISGSIASASFAATASSADNFVVRQNLTGSNVLATGTITAQTLVVQTVTSSIVYSSGSNIFGNQLTDIQQLTGSVRVTGSFNTIGNACITSVCSPAIVGGTVSGTTIYGSTAICGGVICGGATTLTGALSGTSATFSSSVTASGDILANGSSIFTKAASGGYQISLNAQLSTQKFRFDDLTGGAYGVLAFEAGNGTGGFIERMRITSVGVACFSNDICVQGNGWFKGTGNYNTVNIDNTSTTGGGGVYLRQNGTIAGGIGVSGWYDGNTACDMLVVAETGRNIRFYTNGGPERMRITSDGNVGIGCATTNFYSAGAGTFVTIAAPNVTNAEPFLQLIANGTGNSLIDFGTSSVRRATILAFNGSHLTFWTNSCNSGTVVTEKMRITCLGNVGIGTDSPTALLHVNTKSSSQTNMFLTSAWGGTPVQMRLNSNESTQQFNLALESNHPMVFWTNSTERMRITSCGCVQINTTCTPAALLHVAGPLSSNLLQLRSGNDQSTSISFISSQISGGSNDNYAISHIMCHGSSGGYQISHNVDTRWIRIIAGSNGVQLCGAGTSWFSLSDERRKFIHNTIDNGIDVVNKWKPVIYRFCTDVETVRRSGLTAQSILQTRPEAVSYDEHEDLYRVGYTELIPDLVSAIRQQTCIICQLKPCLGII